MLRTVHVMHGDTLVARGHLAGDVWQQFLRAEFPHGVQVTVIEPGGYTSQYRRVDRYTTCRWGRRRYFTRVLARSA